MKYLIIVAAVWLACAFFFWCLARISAIADRKITKLNEEE